LEFHPARLTVSIGPPLDTIGRHDRTAQYILSTCRVKVRDLLRLLAQDGWYEVAQRGSHRQYRHPTKPGKVTVAGKPSTEIPPGTLGNIYRQAGLSRGDH
jgi:predicted RNA binding protein YcfA (HicA-like mRNA interferase family)